MKIFISWSGDRSKQMALALREWLPLVLHYVEPWMSDVDILAGDRWATDVGRELEASAYGIICVTRENLAAPWILFEAGALAKSLSSGAVCPLLLGVDFADLSGPLTQFQAKKFDRASLLDILRTVDEKATQSRNTARIPDLFEALWPRLEAKIGAIPQAQEDDLPARGTNEVLEELVSAIRNLEKRVSGVERRIPGAIRGDRRSTIDEPSVLADATIPPVRVQPRFYSPELEDKKQAVEIHTEGRKALEAIAGAFGLPMEKFGTDWYIEDQRGRHLTYNAMNSLNSYLGNAERALIVTDSPF